MLEHILMIPIMLPLVGAIIAGPFGGRWVGLVALLVTVATTVVSGLILGLVLAEGTQVYRIGQWSPPYGIVLVADTLSATLLLTTSVVASAGVLHGLVTGEELKLPRYHMMFLLMFTALCGVFLTGDLFNLYVFMEMVILSSIVLVAMAARRLSAEVTFKYTILSALASTALLFSIALIYAVLGTLNMADIAQRVDAEERPALISLASAIMLAVFLIKAGIFPFHFWLPDAHSAAPSAVSAMLSGILVKVGVYGVFRISTLLFPESPGMVILGLIGALSALYGGVTALANKDIKRLLAYSTISNVGMIMLAIAWGGVIGITAAVVHTVNHALIKGSLFLSAGYLSERYRERSLSRLSGFAGLIPGIAATFALGAIAVAGLPPTGGFISKIALFRAGFEAGDYVLLSVMLIAGGLSIAYSLRVFVKVFWGATPDWAVEQSERLQPRRLEYMSAALLVAGFLLLGIWPSPLLEIAGRIAIELQQPQLYITAVLGDGS